MVETHDGGWKDTKNMRLLWKVEKPYYLLCPHTRGLFPGAISLSYSSSINPHMMLSHGYTGGVVAAPQSPSANGAWLVGLGMAALPSTAK